VLCICVGLILTTSCYRYGTGTEYDCNYVHASYFGSDPTNSFGSFFLGQENSDATFSIDGLDLMYRSFKVGLQNEPVNERQVFFGTDSYFDSDVISDLECKKYSDSATSAIRCSGDSVIGGVDTVLSRVGVDATGNLYFSNVAVSDGSITSGFLSASCPRR
jgi:hypothetical protein